MLILARTPMASQPSVPLVMMPAPHRHGVDGLRLPGVGAGDQAGPRSL